MTMIYEDSRGMAPLERSRYIVSESKACGIPPPVKHLKIVTANASKVSKPSSIAGNTPTAKPGMKPRTKGILVVVVVAAALFGAWYVHKRIKEKKVCKKRRR
jgi:hypothetical protein